MGHALLGTESCKVRISHLKHCDEVDIVPVNHLIDESDKLFHKALILLEPRGMKVKSKGSSVGVEVTVEVMSQHGAELFWGQDVGAR